VPAIPPVVIDWNLGLGETEVLAGNPFIKIDAATGKAYAKDGERDLKLGPLKGKNIKWSLKMAVASTSSTRTIVSSNPSSGGDPCIPEAK